MPDQDVSKLDVSAADRGCAETSNARDRAISARAEV
jgi:hypothetical protein